MGLRVFKPIIVGRGKCLSQEMSAEDLNSAENALKDH